MERRYLLYILIFGLLCSCSNSDSLHEHVIMDENLMAAYKEFDKSNKAIRSPLLFSSGASVNNCDSYMKLISRGEIVEAVNNKLVKSEYLVCDALRVLSQAARFTGKIDTESVRPTAS